MPALLVASTAGSTKFLSVLTQPTSIKSSNHSAEMQPPMLVVNYGTINMVAQTKVVNKAGNKRRVHSGRMIVIFFEVFVLV